MHRSVQGELNRLASIPKGQNHWKWSENPSLLTLHKRIHRKYGKAKKHFCSKCGKKANDWANITGYYSDKIEDYTPLCRSCHVKLDYTEERRIKTREITRLRHEKNRQNK